MVRHEHTNLNFLVRVRAKPSNRAINSLLVDFVATTCILPKYIMYFADKLIGVHCTHGLNRSGFIICRYMIEELNIPPLETIAGELLQQ